MALVHALERRQRSLTLEAGVSSRVPSPEPRAPPCISNSTPPPPSASCGPPPCPSRSSSARPCSAIPPWRCSTATASTARRASTRRRKPPALKPIIGAELTLTGARGSGARRISARRRREQDESQRRPRDTPEPRAPSPEPRLGPSRPGLFPRGLPQPLPAHHHDEAARAEGRGRAHARGSRWPRRRAGGAGGAAAAAVANATAWAGCSIGSWASSAAHHVYVELQRHLQRDETYDNEMLVSLAEAFRVPILATNGVRFAAPAERPLHDVLTCIREHTTLAQAGRRLVANAERYLKSPAQMARLFDDLPQRRAPPRASWPIGSSSRCRISATASRAIRCRRARPRRRSCARSPTSAPANATGRTTTRRARRWSASSNLIEKLDLGRLLPDRLGHRQLLPPARHPGAGPRLGRQQRRVLQPGHHRRRSGGHGAALRALPVGRARRVARHRSRSAERRSARAGHPARLREVRPARRGHDRQRHHLPRQERGARSGQGAQPRSDADRSAGQGDAQLRVPGRRRLAGEEHADRRRRRAAAAGACTSPGCGSRCRTCRGTSASIPAAW